MSDPSILKAAATTGAALAGCLGIARMFDKALPKSEPNVISEDEDNVGYFLDGPQGTGTRTERLDCSKPNLSGVGPAVSLRALPSDDLPTCPDYIPDWMIPR